MNPDGNINTTYYWNALPTDLSWTHPKGTIVLSEKHNSLTKDFTL